MARSDPQCSRARRGSLTGAKATLFDYCMSTLLKLPMLGSIAVLWQSNQFIGLYADGRTGSYYLVVKYCGYIRDAIIL